MEVEHLYTFVLEFRDGTYIAQVPAASPTDAFPIWIKSYTDEELQEWALSRDGLVKLISERELVAIDGLQNVWCLSGTIDDYFVLLNIIETTLV